MHDDTTLLRTVAVLEDQTGLVFFDALRIWLGGAVQYDYYNLDGIYNHSGGGDQREGSSMRRLEGIFRSQLFDWGEIKAQYDFDEGIFRDLYLRWVSKRTHTPTTVTIGNQKEPFGLDYLSGNKFGIAHERSAPSHAFGSWRSKGVRLHRAFQVAAEDRKVDIFEDDTAFVTTSIGVFTEDIEETNDTDLAVTARITGGTQKGSGGAHLGLAASYREGDFQRISFRPEVREADRIVLAQPQSNTMGILGLEGAFIRGSLQIQAEAHYAQYQGRVSGYGGGGYVHAAWLATGGQRKYNARWVTLAPYNPAGRYSVELFARLSHTRGEDDIGGWNDLVDLSGGHHGEPFDLQDGKEYLVDLGCGKRFWSNDGDLALNPVVHEKVPSGNLAHRFNDLPYLHIVEIDIVALGRLSPCRAQGKNSDETDDQSNFPFGYHDVTLYRTEGLSSS